MAERTCATCGVGITGRADKVYCSTLCGSRAGHGKVCTVDGCDKPYRARGLCSTHYNRRHLPDRHQTVIICETCGTEHTTTRGDGRFCSLLCRDVWRIDSGDMDRPWRDADLYPRTPIPDDHPARWVGDASPVTYRRCSECTAWMVARTKRHHLCSDTCRNKARTRRRLARHARRYQRLRTQVVETHGTDCHVCGYPVHLDVPRNQTDSPTLDHVIPASEGGTDDVENLRLCHLYCNSVKGTRPLEDVAVC